MHVCPGVFGTFGGGEGEGGIGFGYYSNLQNRIEIVSKVFLPQSYAKKSQSCAELLYCDLMLCGSLLLNFHLLKQHQELPAKFLILSAKV